MVSVNSSSVQQDFLSRHVTCTIQAGTNFMYTSMEDSAPPTFMVRSFYFLVVFFSFLSWFASSNQRETVATVRQPFFSTTTTITIFLFLFRNVSNPRGNKNHNRCKMPLSYGPKLGGVVSLVCCVCMA